LVVYSAKKNLEYKKSKSIFYAPYLLIKESFQNLNIVFHSIKYLKKIGPDQVQIYFLKLFYGIKIVVSSIASQASMRKGCSIENFSVPVPGFYLWIYKFLLTLPTSDRKKKEEKKIRDFLLTDGHASDLIQHQGLIAKNSIKKFLGFPNQMLLKKKDVNKNFFFNKKLLIFVPLHKIFSVIAEKISGDK
jgi:hypothetical protein